METLTLSNSEYRAWLWQNIQLLETAGKDATKEREELEVAFAADPSATFTLPVDKFRAA